MWNEIEEMEAVEDNEKRISESLRTEIKKSYLNEKSDYVFVEKIEEYDEDLIEITFTEPFGESTFQQKYRKPNTTRISNHPKLTSLYEDVNADITSPESILELSIPKELVESLEPNQKERNGSEQSKSEIYEDEDCHHSDWNIPENLELYPGNDVTKFEKHLPELFIILAFTAPIFVFTMTSSLPLVIIVFGLFMLISADRMVYNNRIFVPEEAIKSDSIDWIKEGDLLLLDKDALVGKSARTVAKVVERNNSSIEAVTRDGTKYTIKNSERKKGWKINSIDGKKSHYRNNDFKRLYRIEGPNY